MSKPIHIPSYLYAPADVRFYTQIYYYNCLHICLPAIVISLDMQSCWEILGIEKTDDKLAIKRAYTILAHTVSPEDDPEGYQRIHDAYKQALEYADGGSFQSPFIKPLELEKGTDPESEEIQVLPFDYSSVIVPNENLPSDIKYWTEFITSFKGACGISTPQDVQNWKPVTMLRNANMLFSLYRNLYACTKDKSTWDSFFEEPLIRHLTLFHYLDFSALLRGFINEDSEDGKLILDCFTEHKKALNLAYEAADSEQKAAARKQDKTRAFWLAIAIAAISAFCLMFLTWEWDFMENLFALFLGIELILSEAVISCSFRYFYLSHEQPEYRAKMATAYLIERNIFLIAVYVVYLVIQFKHIREYDILNIFTAFVFTCIGAAYTIITLLKSRKRN